jgi:hypothetical protein
MTIREARRIVAAAVMGQPMATMADYLTARRILRAIGE